LNPMFASVHWRGPRQLAPGGTGRRGWIEHWGEQCGPGAYRYAAVALKMSLPRVARTFGSLMFQTQRL
jgi:hypothetical protein